MKRITVILLALVCALSLFSCVKQIEPEEPTAPESVRKYVRYGCSPRAALALASAAKISAMVPILSIV